MSNNDKNQPSVATSAPQPVLAVAPKENTAPANPPVKEPNAPGQVKVSDTAPAQAAGGKK